MLCVFSEFV